MYQENLGLLYLLVVPNHLETQDHQEVLVVLDYQVFRKFLKGLAVQSGLVIQWIH